MKAQFIRELHHDGFTTKYTSYYYILSLSSRNASLGALLGRILTRGSKEYPTMKDIRHREDDLYGTVVYFDMNKFGDQLIFEAKLIMPNFTLLGKEPLEEQAIDYFHSLLYRPLFDDKGGFMESLFEQEKEMLHQELEGLVKNPTSYAHRKCIELLFEGSELGQYKYGDRETLLTLTKGDLLEFYQNMIQTRPLLIYRHGEEENSTWGSIPPYDAKEMKRDWKARSVEETRKVSQSVLVQSFGLPWDFRDERNYPMAVLSHLLGGYASSRLFKKVREEKGLCYSIYTKYDKYRSLMLLIAGHEKAQHKELLEAISQSLLEIQQGEFSLDELEEAKQDLSISLGSLVDSQGQRLDYQFVQDLFNQEEDLQQRIAKVQQVTREQVLEVAHQVKPALNFYLREE